MKKYIVFPVIILLLIIVYSAGPQLENPALSDKLPKAMFDSTNVEAYVKKTEAKFAIRPDNEARVIWYNDSLKNRTEYCVLYLHGFSASWYEGYPVNVHLGQVLKANVYLSRLHDHGLLTNDALLDMQPAKLYESAKQALLIASALGHKIIVLSTSTGGTLALKLAVDFPDLVNELILLSPNIAINNPAAFLLSGPWGLQVARMSGGGGEFRDVDPGNLMEQKYWYYHYRWEGVIYLEQLTDVTMNKRLFRQVKQPLFLGYYYKNEEEQDPVVRVDAMLEMFDQIGTPDSLKRKVAFANAGNHVIGCEALSGCVDEVDSEVLKFVIKTLDNI